VLEFLGLQCCVNPVDDVVIGLLLLLLDFGKLLEVLFAVGAKHR